MFCNFAKFARSADFIEKNNNNMNGKKNCYIVCIEEQDMKRKLLEVQSLFNFVYCRKWNARFMHLLSKSFILIQDNSDFFERIINSIPRLRPRFLLLTTLWMASSQNFPVLPRIYLSRGIKSNVIFGKQ